MRLVDVVEDQGIFRRWHQPGEFERMYLDPESKTVAWAGDLDFAPEPLYEQLVRAAAKA